VAAVESQKPIRSMEQLLLEIDELLKSTTRTSRRVAAAKLSRVAAIASTLAITIYSATE
jgi:hypothetical protein